MVGAYWMDPEVLNNMRPGKIDQDAVLQSTLTYDIAETQNGRFGVLTDASDTQSFKLQWVYSLQDGTLTYSSMEIPSMNTKVEISLVGKE